MLYFVMLGSTEFTGVSEECLASVFRVQKSTRHVDSRFFLYADNFLPNYTATHARRRLQQRVHKISRMLRLLRVNFRPEGEEMAGK